MPEECTIKKVYGQRGEPFPLTEIQYAYWVGRGPNFVLGNVAPHAYFELEGRRLDRAVLQHAWNRLIARHGMLRAIVEGDGRQRILPAEKNFEIGFTDLSGLPTEQREKHLTTIRDDMSHRVYEPAEWPLFDIRITRLDEYDRLHISLDLLMVDLASVTLLFSEWQTLCVDPDVILPPVDISFQDYVGALERNATSRRHESSMQYWTSRARTLPPPPELPLQRSPASVHKPRFTHREFHLDPAGWRSLQAAARDRGRTPTAVLATAFSEVLTAWSGTLHSTLNLTLFNRLPLLLAEDGAGHRLLHPQLRRVVGDFTSICLLEMDNGGSDPFETKVGRTQHQLQQDLRHRHVSALHTMRERRRLGLQSGFDTMPVVFTSGLGTVTDVTGPRDYFGDITYRVSQTPQVWLDHQVVDFTGSLDLTWDAVEELFPADMLDDMFAAYTGLVERLAHDDDAWTGPVRIRPPARQLAARRAANDTAAPLRRELLHGPLLTRAAQAPDRTAVDAPSGALTYGELVGRAHGVASEIRGAARTQGAAPVDGMRDRLVAVMTAKGPEQVVATLGALLSGGAYLPVSPTQPTRRRDQILADGEVVAVVTDGSVRADGRLPEVSATQQITTAAVGVAGPEPDDLAYVLYTSGSTGNPKGVMIEHQAALNTVLDINERFGVHADDRVFGLADLGFDLSVYDLFGTFAAGATLVLPDPDLVGEPAHWIERMLACRVTVWNSVPAQMQMLVEYLEAGGEIPEDLRLVLLSGDWIPVDLPDRIQALWPDARVIGMGGATEASIWSIFHEVASVAEDAPSIPYGKPLRNQVLHVLDAGLEDCPEWVPGELYIGGAGLARGYWRDPEKTAASFISRPSTGERLYRTGDFGRYLPDGSIQFLGRRDSQVKIGGHRIELGEVETVLSRHPEVDNAVVVKTDDGNGARLHGYVVLGDAEDIAGSLHSVRRTAVDDPERLWSRVTHGRADRHGGPTIEDMRVVWADLDDLHAHAAGAALHALGIGRVVGDRFDPAAAIRSAGIAARYERWIARAGRVLCDRGWLVEAAEGLVVAREFPSDLPASVVERGRADLARILDLPADLIDWLMTLAGGVRSVLTQDVHSAELYASDRTPEVYERLFGSTYEVAAAAVRRFVTCRPADRPLRVLEVGSGYGSLTRHLLPDLPADRTTYTFTDISPYFLDNAREAFVDYEFIDYALFTIDSRPEMQGLDAHAADLVIAASVLHDARRIRPMLRNLRSMLAPGGMLLIVEQTTFHPWFDLTMGLQQGFDGYQDSTLRQDHPLLSRQQWHEEIEAAGFVRSATLETDGVPASVGFDVLVACAPDEERIFDPELLQRFAGERLPGYMVPARIYPIDEIPLSGTGKVDRAVLTQAVSRAQARNASPAPPRTERQLTLVSVWQSVLRLPHADLKDDFLEAGGDSLLAARLVATLRSTFGIDIAVAVALEHPTVELLDGYLEDILGPSPLLPVGGKG